MLNTGISPKTTAWKRVDAYTELQGREYGGAIAELVLLHVQGQSQKVHGRWEGRTLDGQEVVDRRAHLGDAVRQVVGAHSDTNARTQEMVQGFVCAGALYAIGAEAQLATRCAGPVAGVLSMKSCGKRFRTHGWMQSMSGKRRRGSDTHECRTRLRECLTREGQARARADPQVLEEAQTCWRSRQLHEWRFDASQLAAQEAQEAQAQAR